MKTKWPYFKVAWTPPQRYWSCRSITYFLPAQRRSASGTPGCSRTATADWRHSGRLRRTEIAFGDASMSRAGLCSMTSQRRSFSRIRFLSTLANSGVIPPSREPNSISPIRCTVGCIRSDVAAIACCVSDRFQFCAIASCTATYRFGRNGLGERGGPANGCVSIRDDC